MIRTISLIALMTIGLFACQAPAPPGTGTGEDTTVVTKEFCGVPPNMLVQLIKNYKTEVWAKTSDVNAGKYDARYMEISIEQLENFIAYAKQSAKHDGLNIASVRMYYINYPGQKKTEQYLAAHPTDNVFEKYAGCHSIALVPVVGSGIRDAARRDYYSTTKKPTAVINNADFNNAGTLVYMPDNCGAASPMENHNELCPPMKGCVTNTLLGVADGMGTVNQ